MNQPKEPIPSLRDRVSERTDVTYGDLALIGAALLTTVTSVCQLGWASPGSSLDYTPNESDPHTMIVRDFVAWTSHRKSLAAGCEERLRAFVDESGWTRHVVDRMGRLFEVGNERDSH
jgi:hypothetical protein